jgi:hypothetical protein
MLSYDKTGKPTLRGVGQSRSTVIRITADVIATWHHLRKVVICFVTGLTQASS